MKELSLVLTSVFFSVALSLPQVRIFISKESTNSNLTDQTFPRCSNQRSSNWRRCKATCISTNQICDGYSDCQNSEDEDPSLCQQWKCQNGGIKCENSDVCIRMPFRNICIGKSACPDFSDKKYCFDRMFFGTFKWTNEGLRISDPDNCYCRLKSSEGNHWIHELKSPLKNRISGPVCLGKDSARICDGVSDCVDGKDELNCTSNRTARIFKDEFKFKDTNSVLLLLILFGSSALVFGFMITGFCLAMLLSIKRKKSRIISQNYAESDSTELPELSSVKYSRPPSETIEDWTWDSVAVVKEIGSGFFGRVFLVKDLNESFSAIKIGEKNKKLCKKAFENEVFILGDLKQNINIINLLGYSKKLEIIVLEYIDGGNLLQYVRESRESFIDEVNRTTDELDETKPMYSTYSGRSTTLLFNTRRLLNWGRQVASGMKFLEESGVIHGDLALRNVLLSTSDDVVKISDFGISSFKDINCRSLSEIEMDYIKPVPIPWMPPEYFKSIDDYCPDHSSDVWSYGVLLWELFTLGQRPYSDLPLESIGSYLLKGNRLPLPPSAPKTFRTLIESCWSDELGSRPDFDSIISIFHITLDYKKKKQRIINNNETLELGYVTMSSRGSTPTIPRDCAYWNGYKIMTPQPL